jgi:hypothetical protein
MTRDIAPKTKPKVAAWKTAALAVACIPVTFALYNCVTGGDLWVTFVAIALGIVPTLLVIRSDVKAAANDRGPSDPAQT